MDSCQAFGRGVRYDWRRAWPGCVKSEKTSAGSHREVEPGQLMLQNWLASWHVAVCRPRNVEGVYEDCIRGYFR